MPKKAESIVWTGKNLAAVKAFHKQVAHYPREQGDDTYRDHSQHPDNLHLTTDEGVTLVVALGDTITRNAEGKLTVEETAKERPKATGRLGPGQVVNAEATERGRAKGTA